MQLISMTPDKNVLLETSTAEALSEEIEFLKSVKSSCGAELTEVLDIHDDICGNGVCFTFTDESSLLMTDNYAGNLEEI